MQRNPVPVGAFVQQLTLYLMVLYTFATVYACVLAQGGPKLITFLPLTKALARVVVRCAGKSGRRDFVDP